MAWAGGPGPVRAAMVSYSVYYQANQALDFGIVARF